MTWPPKRETRALRKSLSMPTASVPLPSMLSFPAHESARCSTWSLLWLMVAATAGSVWAQGAPPAAGTAASAPVAATPASPASAVLSPVEITAPRDDTEQRRVSTAAKIVVGRDEIDQFGDATLADVLKRLPSITIGG